MLPVRIMEMENTNPVEEVRKTEEGVKKEIETHSKEADFEIFEFEEEQRKKIQELSSSLRPEINVLRDRAEKEKKSLIKNEEEKTELECKKIEGINKEQIKQQIDFIVAEFLKS